MPILTIALMGINLQMEGQIKPEPFPRHVMQCVRESSKKYQIPQLAYLGILKQEAGKSGMKKRNKGVKKVYRWDYSYAQVNSANVKMVADKLGLRYKEVEHAARYNDCYNIHLGAYIFKKAIKDCGGDLWCGIGAYHTGAGFKTRKQKIRHKKYQQLVYRKMVNLKKSYRWW